MPPYTPTGSGGSSFAPPAAEELQKLLPKFEILGFIGQGPMGTVYKGRQPQLDRFVAVKLFPVPTGSSTDFVAHFDREAKTMARLSHPRIVTVHDFGKIEISAQDTLVLYLVTEFVKGETLEHVAQNRDFDQKEVLAIVTQVCDALKYAHEHGVIHRDIRPNNTMFDADGMVKVSDFGLAKLMGADLFQSQLTMANQSMRTMDYIAPEQLEPGRDVDQRADVYSVGVMLYKLLCGRLPRGTFVMPSVQNPELDTRLDDIIVRAMQTEPEDRYPDITALWQDIDRVRTAPTIITGRIRTQAPVGKLITGKVETQPPAGKLISGKVSEKASSSHSPLKNTAAVGTADQSHSPSLALPITIGACIATALLALLAFFLFKPDSPDPVTQIKTPAPRKPETRPLPPPEPATKATPPIPTSPPPPPPTHVNPTIFTFTPEDGPLDLLPLTDPNADKIKGNWSLTDNAPPELLSKTPFGDATLSLPARPRGSYRLRTTFTRTNSNKAIGFHLPFGDQSAVWFFNHGQGSAALENIDGKNIHSPNNPTLVQPGTLESNRPYTAEFTVRLVKPDQCEFTVTLDNEPYSSWTGPTKSLKPWTGWAMPDPATIGLITSKSIFTIHSIDLEMLDGEAEILRPLPLNLAAPTLKGEISPVARIGDNDDIKEFGPPPPEAANAVMAALPTTDVAGMLLLTPDGNVVPWFDSKIKRRRPVDVFTKLPQNLSGVVHLALGGNHGLALRKDGSLVAWGDNSQGQCDIPENIHHVTHVTASFGLSIALQKDGTVLAWGAHKSETHPDQVPDNLGPVRAIAAGDQHVLALQEDGHLVGWGRNDFGQSQIELPDDSGEIVAIGAWGGDSYVLTDKNRLYHFGQTPADAVPDLIQDALAFVPGRNCVAVLTPSGEWNYHSTGPRDRLIENAAGATSLAMGQRFIASLKPPQADHERWLASITGAGGGVATATEFTTIPGLPDPNANPPADGSPPPPTAQRTEADDKLNDLFAKYQLGYQESILNDFQTQVATLNEGYLKALKRAESQIAATGDLDQIIPLREEMELVTAAGNRPAEASVPKSTFPKQLKELRAAYHEKIAAYTKNHDDKVATLIPPLDRNLEALQQEFTRQEKIEDAIKIKNARDQIQAGDLPFIDAARSTEKP